MAQRNPAPGYFVAFWLRLLLTLLGWPILKYSVRPPIGPFFPATSGLLALMAVVFAGNGVAALQEAGMVNPSLVHFVSLPLLGVHPTAQGLGLQLAVLALVITGALISRRKAPVCIRLRRNRYNEHLLPQTSSP